MDTKNITETRSNEGSNPISAMIAAILFVIAIVILLGIRELPHEEAYSEQRIAQVNAEFGEK